MREDRIAPRMIEPARPAVGSLGRAGVTSHPPQALEPRLSTVSTVDSSRSADLGHAGARPLPPIPTMRQRDAIRRYPCMSEGCPVLVPLDKPSGICFGCERERRLMCTMCGSGSLNDPGHFETVLHRRLATNDPTYRALVAHPPRDDNAVDRML